MDSVAYAASHLDYLARAPKTTEAKLALRLFLLRLYDPASATREGLARYSGMRRPHSPGLWAEVVAVLETLPDPGPVVELGRELVGCLVRTRGAEAVRVALAHCLESARQGARFFSRAADVGAFVGSSCRAVRRGRASLRGAGFLSADLHVQAFRGDYEWRGGLFELAAGVVDFCPALFALTESDPQDQRRERRTKIDIGPASVLGPITAEALADPEWQANSREALRQVGHTLSLREVGAMCARILRGPVDPLRSLGGWACHIFGSTVQDPQREAEPPREVRALVAHVAASMDMDAPPDPKTAPAARSRRAPHPGFDQYLNAAAERKRVRELAV